jgi:hypothetical protein
MNTLHATMKEESDFLLHVGDISYCNGDQFCWDEFFEMIEPIASKKAYMVCFHSFLSNLNIFLQVCEGNHDVVRLYDTTLAHYVIINVLLS